MEWVETTARTIEEAKELLLDQLGVDENDTEFEILEELKPGLFGRTKGQARVRARVKPKTPPSRDDRRRRTKKDKPADEAASVPAPAAAPAAAPAKAKEAAAPVAASSARREDDESSAERLDSAIATTEAEAFLQGVLDSFGATASIKIDTDENGDLSAVISGTQLGRLIGPRGAVIAAIEELTRTRLQHVAAGGPTPRFKLDIGEYRASRRANLETLVDEVIIKVRETGKPHVLDVVLGGERKLVHDRVAELASDLETHSEGEDPARRVVVSLGTD
ncbi:MAG: hypothetical protein GX868_03605 [Actinobacteria bacterium]|nr:hypothetical protein [Actinomycetota bacterium]